MPRTPKSTETTISLIFQQRASIALASDKLTPELIALAKKYADVVEIKNAAGREQCHSAMMALKTTRTTIEKVAKTARDDANAFSKAVIEEKDRLIGLVEPEEKRLLTLRDNWDAAREAEKEAVRAAEAERVAGLREKIAAIRQLPLDLVGKKSATITAALEELRAREITGGKFAEFAGEAMQVHTETIERLTALSAQALAAEQEAHRIAEERDEMERQRAVRDAEERAAKAIADAKVAADRAELERQQAEVRKQQEEIERQRAEIKREQDAAEQAERERQEAEQRRACEAREAVEREAREKEAAAARERADANHAEFLRTGPGVDAIVSAVAEHFDVMESDALLWLATYTFTSMEQAA